MAFVNAYLTEKEKEEFEKANIRDPRGGFFNGNKFIPSVWTINREHNIALICGGVSNREEYWIETFVLFYGAIDQQHLINLKMTNNSLDLKLAETLKHEYNVDSILRWDIVEYTVPHEIKNSLSVQTLLKTLSDALTTYGISGDPTRQYTAELKVILSINGEFYYGN